MILDIVAFYRGAFFLDRPVYAMKTLQKLVASGSTD
jgi:hypothetical protein